MAYVETWKRVKTLAPGVFICQFPKGDKFCYEVAPPEDEPEAHSAWGQAWPTVQDAEDELMADEGLRALVQKPFTDSDLIHRIYDAVELLKDCGTNNGFEEFSHLSHDGSGDYRSICVCAGGKRIQIKAADVEDENAE